VGQVSVYLGNGDGTFRSPLSLTRGIAPVAVSTGDFNGDGAPDIAVLAQDFGHIGGLVAVFLGNGHGNFSDPILFRLRSHGIYGLLPSAITVGDFDGDGRLDAAIALADGSSNRMSYVGILLGNGDGTFHQGRLAPAGLNPTSVATADFNGDGIPDLVVANDPCGKGCGSPGGVSVLLGNGDGTFQKPQTFAVNGEFPEITVADFNGDGKPDVATANGDSATITVLLNTTQFPSEKR
jgi:hypothetical protein